MLNEEQRKEFLQELAFEAWLEHAEEAYREEQQAMAEMAYWEERLEDCDIEEDD